MAYTVTFTAVTGATILASQHNTGIRDDITAIWVYTAAGSISYSTSATTLAELVKPSVASLLYNDSGGTPSWIAKTSVGGIHAKAHLDANPGGQSIAGDSAWHSISGASFSLGPLAVNCTVCIRGYVVAGCNTAGQTIKVRVTIFGIANDSGQLPETSVGYYVPLPIEYYIVNVPPGTYTITSEAWANGAGGLIDILRLNAYAFAE